MTTKNDSKWLIPSSQYLASKSLEEEKATWDETHKDYDVTTFSITQDPNLCKALIHPYDQSSSFDIPNSPDIKVLIPNCGSEIYLQKALIDFCPQIGQIYCTDFSTTGITKARENWQKVDGDSRLNNQQIVFEEIDSTKITKEKPDWKEKFDYILAVAAVVSSEDEINRQIIHEFSQVLKPGGKLYGCFPTIFSPLEIAHLSQKHAYWVTEGLVNVGHNKLHGRDWHYTQIHYTPLRLNRIFKETGFKRLNFEIYFFDSEVLANVLKEDIEHDDPDIFLWDLLVRYEKK
jgi:SAM-dependent methyltransferase